MKRFIPLLPQAIAFLAALIGGSLLFSQGSISGLVTIIINIGLDPLRAQLVAALIMAAGTALVGAFIGQRKSGAVFGALVVFCLAYILGFIQLEMRPVYDPGGFPEPLNQDALLTTVCAILALGSLSAFVGAAVGVALGEVLLAPPFQLISLLRRRWARQAALYGPTQPILESVRVARPRAMNIASWIALFTMVALIILASGSGDLFLFSPDTGLHGAPPSIRGTVVQESFRSASLHGASKQVRVYLPPYYNAPDAQSKRYPTVYLLHGSPGTDIDWFVGGKVDQSANTLIAAGKISDVIIVVPDGNGRPGAMSEWGNSYDQKQLIENYVAFDLVKYIDHTYRTIPDAAHRAIGGLSMGGFGAINIALHHPQVFGSVISLGGYYVAEGSIWGSSLSYRRMNSPLYVLPVDKGAWKLHYYIGAATRDQPYYNDSLQFVKLLSRLHIPYRLDIQKGYHAWRVWQVQMYNALLWLKWK